LAQGWNIFREYGLRLEFFLTLWPRIKIVFSTLAYG
jgi:hypothetical protein